MFPCPNLRLLAGLTLLLLIGADASAQTVALNPSGKFQKQSLQQFRDQLTAMRTLVQACASSAPACEPEKVGPDQRIEAPSAQTFQVRWQWLRDALDQSRTAKPGERTQLMQQSSARIAEMLQRKRPA